MTLATVAALLSRLVASSHTAKLLWVVCLAFLYYTVSIAMSLFNKYILTSFDGGDFKYPLSMTCVHLILKFLLSAAVLGFPCCRMSAPWLLGGSKKEFWTLVLPIGVCTALDIGLSNVSLLTVTLTLYTIGACPCPRPFASIMHAARMQCMMCRVERRMHAVFSSTSL